MKTKHSILFGFAVLLVAAIFSLTGCEDPNGGNTSKRGDATINLESGGTNILKITLNGATFVSDVESNFPKILTTTGPISQENFGYYVDRVSDTEITVTLGWKSAAWATNTGSGTVKLFSYTGHRIDDEYVNTGFVYRNLTVGRDYTSTDDRSKFLEIGTNNPVDYNIE